jgi:hypothetical protein
MSALAQKCILTPSQAVKVTRWCKQEAEPCILRLTLCGDRPTSTVAGHNNTKNDDDEDDDDINVYVVFR